MSNESDKQGSTPPDDNAISRATPRFVVLATVMAISVAVATFAATATATADPIVRPYAIAIALALCIGLILFGWVDVNKASKGLLSSTISLLPNLHLWGVANAKRTLAIGSLFAAIAFGSVWIGPGGLITQTVKCGEASHVEFSVRSDRLDCEGALTRNIWLSPLEQQNEIQLFCFDARTNRWDGVYHRVKPSICGKRPQDAQYVTNGIALPDHDPATVAGKRLSEGLDRMRTALKASDIPDRRVKDRLVFATWNIRNLGRYTKGPGKRLDESYAFIAEVLSHFDIVAVQELQDRSALTRLLGLLGEDYKAEFSFIAPGNSGNRERMGFIYDSRKVSFGDISTTIVFESTEDSSSTTGQPARPPFLAEFIVNKRSFFIATAHAYFGRSSGPKYERRLQELKQMASGLDRTFRQNFPDHPVIFAGDLNVSAPDSPEMNALLNNGFESLKELRDLPTNYVDTKPYDQILLRSQTASKMPIGRFGVFKPLEIVFRDSELPNYRIDIQKMNTEINRDSDVDKKYFRRFRSQQISDHHVKWAEFRLDW